MDERQAIATTHAAIDAGVTFIDTAESYRASEEVLGRALAGRRGDVFLATKISGDHSAEHIREALGNSLRALRTDYVDLYQIHGPKPEWPIEDTMGELVRHRDEGKIRYLGVSNFSAEQTEEALQFGSIHSSQPRFNMIQSEPRETLLPYCLERGIGVIPHSPLAKGFLTGKYRAGHQFPEDDERNDHPYFPAHVLNKTFAAVEKPEGLGVRSRPESRRACNCVDPGASSRCFQYRRGQDARAGTRERGGGGLGIERDRHVRNRRADTGCRRLICRGTRGSRRGRP